MTSWLLRERRGGDCGLILERADVVAASTLTRVECVRAQRRRAREARTDFAVLTASLGFLDELVSGWRMQDMTDLVLDRASRTFPVEPVGTLDAIHLATALEFHAALGSLTMLSLDERIRANAAALGMEVAP